MSIAEKKILATLIGYVDDVVEERLKQIEETVSELPFQIEEGALIVEGPKGERGPRGFRGPVGERGDKGDTPDPLEIKQLLAIDEDFVSLTKGPRGEPGKDASPSAVAESLKEDLEFLSSVRGPKGEKGERGEKGDTPDIYEVVGVLRRSKSFLEEVRGPKGNTGERGDIGPVGPVGVGLREITVDSEGNIIYEKTDGEIQIAGAINLPEPYNDNELKGKLKELSTRVEHVSSRITQIAMASGGSGSGEVNIKRMDDFDINANFADGASLVWNEGLKKFTLQDVAGINLEYLEQRIAYIEDHLQLQTPPDIVPEGIQWVELDAVDYLASNGYELRIEREEFFEHDLISVLTFDQNGDLFEPGVTIDSSYVTLSSPFPLFGTKIYYTYIPKFAEAQTYSLEIKLNDLLSPDGLYCKVDYGNYGFSVIDSLRVMDLDEVKEVVVRYNTGNIELFSNTPMWGMKLHTYVHDQGDTGLTLYRQALNGLIATLDLGALGFTQIVNIDVIDTSTNEPVGIAVNLQGTQLLIQSNIDMQGYDLRIWHL